MVKIKWSKRSSTVPSLVGALILAWFSSAILLFPTFDRQELLSYCCLSQAWKNRWMNFYRKVLQRICSLILPSWATCSSKKNLLRFIALSAIFMFVFLIVLDLRGASFMLLGFNGVRDAVDNFTLANILRQWIVVSSY